MGPIKISTLTEISRSFIGNTEPGTTSWTCLCLQENNEQKKL